MTLGLILTVKYITAGIEYRNLGKHAERALIDVFVRIWQRDVLIFDWAGALVRSTGAIRVSPFGLLGVRIIRDRCIRPAFGSRALWCWHGVGEVSTKTMRVRRI
jgi:hypothetical protein